MVVMIQLYGCNVLVRELIATFRNFCVYGANLIQVLGEWNEKCAHWNRPTRNLQVAKIWPENLFPIVIKS